MRGEACDSFDRLIRLIGYSVLGGDAEAHSAASGSGTFATRCSGARHPRPDALAGDPQSFLGSEEKAVLASLDHSPPALTDPATPIRWTEVVRSDEPLL